MDKKASKKPPSQTKQVPLKSETPVVQIRIQLLRRGSGPGFDLFHGKNFTLNLEAKNLPYFKTKSSQSHRNKTRVI